MKNWILSTMMITCLVAPAAAGATDADRLFQQGLYQQHTLGDLDSALESYRQVLQAAPDAQLEEQALLRLGECLEWAGKPGDVIEVVARLDKSVAEQADRLGPARHFPTGLHVVMQADLRRMLSSRIKDLLGAEMEIEPKDLEQLVAALGIDPFRDLHRVSLGVELGSDERFPVQRFVVQLEGELGKLVDLPSILKLAQLVGKSKKGEAAAPELAQLNLRETTVAGQRVQVMDLPVPEAPGGKLTLSMAKPDGGNLLLGMGGAVADTLKARVGRTMGLRADTALKRMADRLPEKEDLWLLASPSRLLERVAQLDKDFEIPAELPVLTGLLLGASFSEQVELTVSAWAEDKQSAQEATDLARGGLALLRIVALAEEEMPEAAKKMVRELDLVTEDQEIRLQVNMPWSLVEEAMGVAKKPAREIRLQMKVGDRRSLKIEGWTRAKVVDSKVVDIQHKGQGRFTVKALAAGETSIDLWDEKGASRKVQIQVLP